MLNNINNGVSEERLDGGELLLAFETGVGGGSISLFRRGVEIDFWIGSGVVSRSEDILEEIDRMLQRNDTNKKNIGRVVFSSGPGSYTGLRIGASLAKGLSKALGCRLSACGVLRAMSFGETGIVLSAIPFGRGQACRQYSYGIDETGAASSPEASEVILTDSRSFGEFLVRPRGEAGYNKLILHESLYREFSENGVLEFLRGAPSGLLLKNAGGNLAGIIARKFSEENSGPDITTNSRLIYPSEVVNFAVAEEEERTPSGDFEKF